MKRTSANTLLELMIVLAFITRTMALVAPPAISHFARAKGQTAERRMTPIACAFA